MSETFDPYYKWLGIAAEDQPPTLYGLLGLRAFEHDPDVIETCGDQRMVHLRTFQAGEHSAESQKLLNEVAKAALDSKYRGEAEKVSIHAPKFGAGLAGGDWKQIEGFVQRCLVDKGLDVTIYEFDG